MLILSLVGAIGLMAGLPGETAYLQGYDAYRAGDYARARQAFETSAQIDPALAPWAVVREGLCLAGQGNESEAESMLNGVIEGPSGPWRDMARGHLARLAAKRNDPAAIVTRLEGFEAVKPAPWWMDSYLWQFSDAVIKRPETGEAGFSFFRDTVLHTDYIKPRLEASRQLVKSPSPQDQALALLGMLRSSAYDEIEGSLTRVTIALPGAGGQTIRVALLAEQLLDAETANDSAALAIAMRHPEDAGARFVLAYASRIWAQRKEYARAEALCTALVDIDPASRDAGDAIWWLGGVLERAERFEDAERVLELLPSRCPSHFRADDALNKLGELYLAHGNPKKGMEYLLRLGREYPESRFRAGAYYTCATHPAIQGDADLKRLYLKSAAEGAIGYFYAHRALARLHDLDEPGKPPAINLRVDGVNPVLLPAEGYLEPLPPIPPMITDSIEYQRLAWFARHGLEESEWELLPLLQGLEKIEFKEPYYRAFAEAGLAHTALQFATHEGWGIDENGERTPARLRLEYPLAYWDEVKQLAGDVGIDPYLILAVAKQESTFRPNLTSHAGASGVMQLMPGTAKWLAGVDPSISAEHVANLESPVNSLRLGAHYLLRMYERSGGNLVDTLASYNGGPGNRDKWRKQFPNYELDQFVESIPFEETRTYVQKVLGNYAAYRSLYGPAT